MDVKFAGAVYNSEQFNTAGRSIGTGLLAVDIVSHWTWASILLSSVTYGYFYGITGSYWCATVPLLFSANTHVKSHSQPKCRAAMRCNIHLALYLSFTAPCRLRNPRLEKITMRGLGLMCDAMHAGLPSMMQPSSCSLQVRVTAHTFTISHTFTLVHLLYPCL